MKKVKTFTEKPDLEMAKFFRQSGDFLWNAGIFIWSVKSVLKAFEKYMPEMHTLFNDGLSKLNTEEEAEFIKNTYPQCKNISIDYGIMEKAANVYVRSSAIGWSDLDNGAVSASHRKRTLKTITDAKAARRIQNQRLTQRDGCGGAGGPGSSS